jgi:hypothetical protein
MGRAEGGRKEQARRDAAFERGAVGVDGAATQEQKDSAAVDQDQAREQLFRGKTYLGRELLTWLLWKSESTEPVLSFEGESVEVVFQDRLTLRGAHGEVTELSVKGALAPYSEQVRFGLERGLLVHQARLQLTHGEKSYQLTLDAEHLDVRAARLPELMTEEEDDRAAERLYLAEQLGAMVEALVNAFVELRTTRAWRRQVVPQMRQWMAGAPDEGNAPKRKVG